MKIAKIKKMSSGKYKVTLDNQEKLITYDEVLLKNGLLFQKELNHDMLNQIQVDTTYYDIYSKLVKMIATRMRSEYELRKYLEEKAVPREDQEKMIAHLKSCSLINEKVFAEAYLSDQFHFTNHGPNQIKEDLMGHGIKEEFIFGSLEKISKEEWSDKLKNHFLKKIRLNHKYSGYLLKQKLVMEAVLLGYDRDMANETYPETTLDKSILEKEYQKWYVKLSKKLEGNALYYQIKQKLYQKGFQKDEIDDLFAEKNRDF